MPAPAQALCLGFSSDLSDRRRRACWCTYSWGRDKAALGQTLAFIWLWHGHLLHAQCLSFLTWGPSSWTMASCTWQVQRQWFANASRDEESRPAEASGVRLPSQLYPTQRLSSPWASPLLYPVNVERSGLRRHCQPCPPPFPHFHVPLGNSLFPGRCPSGSRSSLCWKDIHRPWPEEQPHLGSDDPVAEPCLVTAEHWNLPAELLIKRRAI